MAKKTVPFLFFILFTFSPILLVCGNSCSASVPGKQNDGIYTNNHENGDDEADVLIRKGINIVVDTDENEQADPDMLSEAIFFLEKARTMITNGQSEQDQPNSSDRLHYLYYLGLAYFKMSEFELFPKQYDTLSRGAIVLQDGLNDDPAAEPKATATKRNLSTVEKVNFLRLLGRIFYNMRQKCEAANKAYLPWLELLEKQQLQRGRKEISQLTRIPKSDRMLLVDSIGNCHPSIGVKLWDEMLDGGDLSIITKRSRTSSQILLGYSMMFAAHWRVGGLPAAQRLFDRLRLNETTPWRWPSQIPPQVNVALLSEKHPEPWLDPKQFPVCRALEAHKADIIEEFMNYKKKLNLQHDSSAAPIPNLFEHHHFDSALSLNHEWTHLYLKRSTPSEGIDGNVGWLESRCKSYFPKTCEALAGFPEVEGRLLYRSKDGDGLNCGNQDHDNQGYMAWCNQAGTLAGTVVFMTIPPKEFVHLHTGVTNQRLKCHLVVTAPPKDDIGTNITGGAWIEVAGEKHLQETGMVFAWDDSFYHAVYNMGDEERVVLDVTFWHPDLVTDLHEQSEATAGTQASN